MEITLTEQQVRAGEIINISIARIDENGGISSDPIFQVELREEIYEALGGGEPHKDGTLYISVYEVSNPDSCIENHYPEYFALEK